MPTKKKVKKPRGPFRSSLVDGTPINIQGICLQIEDGNYVFVDEEDVERVKRYRWKVRMCGYPKRPYIFGVVTKEWAKSSKKSASTFKAKPLHRYLLRPAKGKRIYFKNGLTFDCRKSNLTHDPAECIYYVSKQADEQTTEVTEAAENE